MPECAMFIENECRCDPPPPRFKQWYISRSTNFTGLKSVSLDKNLSKNLNCFAAKRQKFSGFPKSPNTSHQKCPKKHFLCVIINSKRRTALKNSIVARSLENERKNAREKTKNRAQAITRRRFARSPQHRARASSFALSDFLDFCRSRGVRDLSKCALSNYPK